MFSAPNRIRTDNSYSKDSYSNITRIEETSKEYEFTKVENILNFDQYQLKEKKNIFDKIDKRKLNSESEIIFKCRKIRL